MAKEEVPISNLIQAYFPKAAMWPHHLQMSSSDCRGTLRRLELETYSLVVSVFRAQGGLNDSKAKLLDELRALFHISLDRHRAEARRVANDEQLATIARLISGPNTWLEWSREGRRPYPLLPRVAPQTALSIIANSVTERVSAENRRLPYPSETGDTAKVEQLQRERTNLERSERERHPSDYVITTEPFKVPDIPVTCRKNLKRSSYDKSNNLNRKRMFAENILPKDQQINQEGEITQTRYSHATTNSNTTFNSDVTNGKNVFNTCRLLKNEQNQRIHRTHQLAQQQKQKQSLNKQQGSDDILQSALRSQSQGYKTLLERNKAIKRAAENISSGNEYDDGSAAKKTTLTPKSNKGQQQKVNMLGRLVNKKGSMYKQNERGIGHNQQNLQQLKDVQELLPILQQYNEMERLGSTEIASGRKLNTRVIKMASQCSASVVSTRKSMSIGDEKELVHLQSNTNGNIVKNVTQEQKSQYQQSEEQIIEMRNNSDILEILTPPIGAILPSSKFEKCHPLSLALTMATTTTTTTISGSTVATVAIKRHRVEDKELLLNVIEREKNVEHVEQVNRVDTVVKPPIVNSTVQTTTGQILKISNISIAGQKLGHTKGQQILAIDSNSLVSPGGTKMTMSASVVKKLTNLGAANIKNSLSEIKGGNPTLISNVNSNMATSAATAAAAVALHELANIAGSSQKDIVKELQDQKKPMVASRNLLISNQSIVRNQLISVVPTTITTIPLRTATSVYNSGISGTKNILTNKLRPVVLTASTNLQNANNMLIDGSANGRSNKFALLSKNCVRNKSSDILKIISTTTTNINSSTNNIIISTAGMLRGLTTSNSQKIPAILSASVITTATTTPILQTSVANIVGGNKSNKPQIISNIKLPPFTVTPTTSATAIAFGAANASSKTVVTTGMKLCHSSNGKVFLQQSTNQVDNSKLKLSSSNLGQHKTTVSLNNVNSGSGLSSNIILGGIGALSGAGSSITGTVGLSGNVKGVNQRYSLQKVQIIHATPTFSTQNTAGTISNTYGIGGNLLCKSPTGSNINLSSPNATILSKSNMIIMPSPPSSTPSVRTIYGKNNTNNMVLKAITSLTGNSGASGVNDCSSSHVIGNTAGNINRIQYSTKIQSNAMNAITLSNIPKVSGTGPGQSVLTAASSAAVKLQRPNIVVLDNNNINIPFRSDSINNMKNIKIDSSNVTANIESGIALTANVNATVTATVSNQYSILDDNDVTLDIMNMPIVVDSGNGERPESMTLLDNGTLISGSSVSGGNTTYVIDQPPQLQPLVTKNTSSGIVMNATDWELELDNAVTAMPSNRQQGVNSNNSNNDSKYNKSAIFTLQRCNVLKSKMPSSSLLSSFHQTTATVTSVATAISARGIVKPLLSTTIKNVSSNLITSNNNSATRIMQPNHIITDQSLLASSLFQTNANRRTMSSNAGVSTAGDVGDGITVSNIVLHSDNFENVIVEDYNEECNADEILSSPSSLLLKQSKEETNEQQCCTHIIQEEDLPLQIPTLENTNGNFILEQSRNNIWSGNAAETHNSAESSNDRMGSLLTANGSDTNKSDNDIKVKLDETIVGAIDENTAIEFIGENGQTTPLSEVVPHMVASLQLFNKTETTTPVTASSNTPTSTPLTLITNDTSPTITNTLTTPNSSNSKVWTKVCPSILPPKVATCSTSSSLSLNVISLNKNLDSKNNLMVQGKSVARPIQSPEIITDETVAVVTTVSVMSDLESYSLEDILPPDNTGVATATTTSAANMVTTDTASTIFTDRRQNSENLSQAIIIDNNNKMENIFMISNYKQDRVREF